MIHIGMNNYPFKLIIRILGGLNMNERYSIPKKTKSFSCHNDAYLTSEEKASFIKCAQRGDTGVFLVLDTRDLNFYELTLIRAHIHGLDITPVKDKEPPCGYETMLEWWATTSQCAMWQHPDFFLL